VVGNPANTNALVCSKYAPSIPKENFTAMTRLDQNRAQAQIAARMGVGVDCVRNVIIWGNHSSTQYPDARFAVVRKGAEETKLVDNMPDTTWLQDQFITTVQKRGASVIAARKMSSAMSAAKAAGDHMRDWWLGTPEGTWVSMGVISDGSYASPPNVIFSFPVVCANKQWTIVQGLELNDFSRNKIEQTGQELSEEKEEAFAVCQD
jgi:malate dehydrogenase